MSHAREERQAHSYAATMRSRDARWMGSARYSQKALIDAHLKRILEICEGCPPLEEQTLNQLLTFIETRATTRAQEEHGKRR